MSIDIKRLWDADELRLRRCGAPERIIQSMRRSFYTTLYRRLMQLRNRPDASLTEHDLKKMDSYLSQLREMRIFGP
jgi:hypothetical protein